MHLRLAIPSARSDILNKPHCENRHSSGTSRNSAPANDSPYSFRRIEVVGKQPMPIVRQTLPKQSEIPVLRIGNVHGNVDEILPQPKQGIGYLPRPLAKRHYR